MEEKGPEADVVVIGAVKVPGEKDLGDTNVVVEGDDEKVVSGSDDTGWDSAISIEETERVGTAPYRSEETELMKSQRWVMSMHASILVGSVGPPSAEVCRTAASFP
jgi:hypothetical protein